MGLAKLGVRRSSISQGSLDSGGGLVAAASARWTEGECGGMYVKRPALTPPSSFSSTKRFVAPRNYKTVKVEFTPHATAPVNYYFTLMQYLFYFPNSIRRLYLR